MTPGKTRTHLVWDWNGTLLDDIHAVIHATNAAFAEVELAPLTLEQYRETYCVPIPRFYERLLGRQPTAAEWERMDDIFHRYYAERRVGCGLTAGAEELLAQWKLAGHSQSILSMYGHEHLVPVVRGYGIES
ncbi:HAD family hydrolase, partial [Streptomyces cavourensis]